jgi:membrane-associated phospholipid phosphatase
VASSHPPRRPSLANQLKAGYAVRHGHLVISRGDLRPDALVHTPPSQAPVSHRHRDGGGTWSMRLFLIPSPREHVKERFWEWPDVRTWRTYVWVALAGAAWFVLLYGGADYFTSRRSLRVPVHFEAELRIPFIASAVWIYMSIYALFLMCPFVLRSSRRIIALGATLAAVTSAATIGFLLIPAELAFPSPAHANEAGATALLYTFADWLNLRHNLLPSLHVALSVTCIAAYAPRARRAGRFWLWSWALAVAVSTVLTHFHHILDAVSGFVLGLTAVRAVYHPLARASNDGDSANTAPPQQDQPADAASDADQQTTGAGPGGNPLRHVEHGVVEQVRRCVEVRDEPASPVPHERRAPAPVQLEIRPIGQIEPVDGAAERHSNHVAAVEDRQLVD